MHFYSVNSKIRSSVNFFLIIMSALIFFVFEEVGLIKLLINIESGSPVISELSRFSLFSIACTPVLIYKTLFCIFNKYFWKISFIKRMTGVPDLNGRYKGKLISTFNKKEIDMELCISQTFTQISFTSIFDNSISNSSLARILRDEESIACFDFIYDSDSNDIDVETGHHTGVNTLNFNKKNKKLSGRYFNDRGYQPNKGRIELKKIN